MSRVVLFLNIIIIGLIYNSCSNSDQKIDVIERTDLIKYNCKWDIKAKLSDYNMFEEPLRKMIPKSDLIPYELASELFSDYAKKKRFIYLPPQTNMTHIDFDRSFEFPDEAIIFKYFYYPKEESNDSSAYTIIETRVLHKIKGKWQAYSYVWNENQTDAYLQLAGDNKMVSWKNKKGEQQSINYSIPNAIQCKTCHEYKDEIIPIGPAARHLANSKNRPDKGILPSLIQEKKLKGLDLNSSFPHLINYTDTSFVLDHRARSYIDINCAHCHQPHGSARNSALNLLFTNHNFTSLGIYKTPIAAGNGSGGLYYDIVPGNPKESILYYRMNSSAPGIAMPEVGRKMIHHEGLALVEAWIKDMK